MSTSARRPSVPLSLFQAVVQEHPIRDHESVFDYLDRIAVLSGALKPGEGRLPADYAFHATAEERARPAKVVEVARLPYREDE